MYIIDLVMFYEKEPMRKFKYFDRHGVQLIKGQPKSIFNNK